MGNMADNMDQFKIGRRHVLIFIIILALFDIASVIVLFAFPGLLPERIRESAQAVSSQPEPQAATEPAQAEPQEPAEPAEPAPQQPEPAPAETAAPAQPAEQPASVGTREVIARHTVKEGDTFYDIAGSYWPSVHLWPDLYMLNRAGFPNPDLIEPGQVIRIYQPLGTPGELTPAAKEVLLTAYVDTYKVYRSLGEAALSRGRATGNNWLIQLGRIRINKAHWLLYSGLRFDHQLLETYAGQIQDRDARVVRDYVKRFGYVDP